MTEMERREAGIDSLLRSSMAAPVPTLSPDFEQRVIRGLRPGSRALGRNRRILLACYGLLSVVTSAVVMRGEGLDWAAIDVMILAPLALAGIVSWASRSTHATMRPSAK